MSKIQILSFISFYFSIGYYSSIIWFWVVLSNDKYLTNSDCNTFYIEGLYITKCS